MRSPIRFILPLLVALFAANLSYAQGQPGDVYVIAPEKSQGGTGKFYMDREISGVMGHQAADWLERPQRTHEEMPDEVVAALELKPADVVADIGAGSGYFSFRMAKLVPQGKVLAVDIQPEMLAMIEERKNAEDVDNVEGILGEIDDTSFAGELGGSGAACGCVPRVFSSAGNAGEYVQCTEAGWTYRVAGVSCRGSDGAHQASAQDDGNAGSEGDERVQPELG